MSYQQLKMLLSVNAVHVYPISQLSLAVCPVLFLRSGQNSTALYRNYVFGCMKRPHQNHNNKFQVMIAIKIVNIFLDVEQFLTNKPDRLAGWHEKFRCYRLPWYLLSCKQRRRHY